MDISKTDIEISKEKVSDLKEHLRILEKANKILKTQIKTKDAETENLKNNIKSLEREMKFKSEKSVRAEEKFEKMAMEISLKGITGQIKNAEEVIKDLENFYERVGKEEIYLVGNYPEIFNGLTYVDKHSVVKTSNCKTVSPQKLKKISNIYYIERLNLEEVKAGGDVESIIKEYRKARML
ncbi:MAG: hypothetical protein CVU81_00115 [Euryarchaeota archaeon HGW-Euryarchaeota-1]|nr:MAG: hypothetical protein CVU81_00115 [Euryarchaeota archaeon HGW-Euryarchaeota-1]